MLQGKSALLEQKETVVKVREEEQDTWKCDVTGMVAGCVGLKLQGVPWEELGTDRPLAWNGRHSSLCLHVPTTLQCCFPNTL